VLTTIGFPTITHSSDRARFTKRFAKEGIPPDREDQLWELVTGESTVRPASA
jgi:hypothetical protein